MKITSGIIKRAQKVVMYGPEGIGKSTFASKFPDPLFIDTEGSTAQLDVKRMESPTSYSMLLQEVKYVAQNPTVCRTLVIDTADWTEKLCKQHILAKNNWDSIESPSYGRGYTVLAEEWGKLLELLNEVIEAGVNVLLTAHAMTRKFEQPDEMGSYDRFELKLEKKTAPMTKEWADIVLFANYKTDIITDSKTNSKKAIGGKRVIYTSHHPAWDAKNRAGLPEIIEMDFQEISHLFEPEGIYVVPKGLKDDRENPKTPPYQPPEENNEKISQALLDLMKANHVTKEEIQKVVTKKGHFPDGMPIEDYPKEYIDGVLIGAWDQVLQEIENSRNGLPFDI